MAQRDDGLDLSYLSDDPEDKPKSPRSGEVIAQGVLGRDFYKKPNARRQAGKSIGAVERVMSNMSLNPTPQLQRIDMTTVDVKCNYAKDRNVVLAGGQLILTFDKNGVAKMPIHQMALLEQVQRARPGRFTVVRAEAPKKVEAPKKAVVAPKKAAPSVVEHKVVQVASKDKAKASVPKKKKKKGTLVSKAKTLFTKD